MKNISIRIASIPQPDWFDRLYFGKFRSWGGNKFFRWFFIGAFALTAWLLVVVCTSEDYFIDTLLLFWPIAAIGIICIIGWACVRFVSYKKTNMMLRIDSPGKWSIHMGAFVSLCPIYYALMPKNFISEGEVTILKAAKSSGLSGVIILKSHLYGDTKFRRKRVIQLISELGPGYDFSEKNGDESLGLLFSIWLTILRNFLFLRINIVRCCQNSGGIIPTKKFCPLKASVPVGIILISIPSRMFSWKLIPGAKKRSMWRKDR